MGGGNVIFFVNTTIQYSMQGCYFAVVVCLGWHGEIDTLSVIVQLQLGLPQKNSFDTFVLVEQHI